jgi:hypothetical protein
MQNQSKKFYLMDTHINIKEAGIILLLTKKRVYYFGFPFYNPQSQIRNPQSF